MNLHIFKRRRKRECDDSTLLVGNKVIVPFGGANQLVAQLPEERYYGEQRPGIVQITLTYRSEPVRVILPAYVLRAIADRFDPEGR